MDVYPEDSSELDDEDSETTETVTYHVNAETVETLHIRCLKYRLLYREACRRLKKCLAASRTLENKLDQARCVNRGLTTEQFRLQTELDACDKSKMDLQNLFFIFGRRAVNISNEQLKRQEIHHEKQELKLLQEKLQLQESEFQRYERESDVEHPTTTSTGETSAEQRLSEETRLTSAVQEENLSLNMRLLVQKMERETDDLQKKLNVSEKSNDELLHIVNALQENRDYQELDLKRCTETIDLMNKKLLDAEQEQIELLNKENAVLMICEREKNALNDSLQKCRESLFEKENEFENAVEAGKRLEHKLLIVNQDLENARQTTVNANQLYEAEIAALTSRNENLLVTGARASEHAQEVMMQNDKLLSDLNLCHEDLNKLREFEHSQRLDTSSQVNSLLTTIELNNAEYLKTQKENKSKQDELQKELKAAQHNYRTMKKEKTEISDRYEKLESRMLNLTRDITDLRKLKEHVNRFISENHKFITDLEIPEALSKIRDLYQDNFQRFEELQELHENLRVKHNETVISAEQYQKISEEQRFELDAVKATLDELRLENHSLKTFGSRISPADSLLSSDDRTAKQLTKLKRYYRGQLAVKRAEISQLIKKSQNLRRETGSLIRQRRSQFRVYSDPSSAKPCQGQVAAAESSRGRKVVELELEVLRLRGECRSNFLTLHTDYQTLLEESAAERQKLNQEINQLQDSNELQLRLRYYTLLVEHISEIMASTVDIEDCPEGLVELIETVRDFRDFKLNISRMRSSSQFKSGQISNTDISLFKTVQSSLASEELQTLRIIKRRYDVIVSALQHLLSEDMIQIVSALFEYRLIFGRGELLELTNYLRDENLNMRILRERGDIQYILGMFFGNTLFSSSDVTSLVETLNVFGGREFLQSLKHVVALRHIHPEYGILLNTLKEAGTPNQIDNFLIYFQLINDIRLNHPRETNLEQLKHDYIRDNLNHMFGLDIENLENYFYLNDPRRRKKPKRRVSDSADIENSVEDVEDIFTDCY